MTKPDGAVVRLNFMNEIMQFARTENPNRSKRNNWMLALGSMSECILHVFCEGKDAAEQISIEFIYKFFEVISNGINYEHTLHPGRVLPAAIAHIKVQNSSVPKITRFLR